MQYREIVDMREDECSTERRSNKMHGTLVLGKPQNANAMSARDNQPEEFQQKKEIEHRSKKNHDGIYIFGNVI